MLNDIQHLIDTLFKVEALHAGATTPGERDAAGAAIERIKKKLAEFVESDPPMEMRHYARTSRHDCQWFVSGNIESQTFGTDWWSGTPLIKHNRAAIVRLRNRQLPL